MGMINLPMFMGWQFVGVDRALEPPGEKSQFGIRN
jgi:hypothetical protein